MRSAFFLVLIAAALAACSSAPPGGTADVDRDANRQRRRAALQIQAGEYAAAVVTIDTLLARFPQDDNLHVMMGDAQRGAGDADAAVKAYEQAIRLNYGAHEPHMKLGVVLMETGKTGRALSEFETALKFGETDPLLHYNYGLALRERGKNDQALAQWKIARDRDPGNAEYVAAVALGLTGVDDSLAVALFREAEALGMKGAAFSSNFALALERTGLNDEAEARFRVAVDASTGAGQIRYRRNLALHLLRTGRPEAAARELETLVAVDGGRWSDSVYLARARLDLGRFEEAVAGLEGFARDLESGAIARSDPRVDRMPPGLDEALDILGMAWRGRGDLARASDYLARAVALRPDDPVHLNNHGVVLAERGMLADARAKWLRVLEIDPGNATARGNLSAFGP
jgi:Flp pilus assembly protein TadD